MGASWKLGMAAYLCLAQIAGCMLSSEMHNALALVHVATLLLFANPLQLRRKTGLSAMNSPVPIVAK